MLTMSKRRKRLRDRKSSDVLRKRRERFLPVLEKLGVVREFEQLPDGVRRFLCLRTSPRPEIALDAQAAQDRRAPDIRAAVDNALDEINAFELDVPAFDAEVSIAEFFMCVEPLCEVLRIPEAISECPPLARLEERLKPILDEPDEVVRICALAGLQFVLSGYSRIDTALFRCQYEREQLPHERHRARIHVHKHPANVIRIDRYNRDPIRAFRAGGVLSGEDMEWIAWEPAIVGLKQPHGRYPVFVSSHALRKHDDRVSFVSPHDNSCTWISLSLHEPKVAKTMPDGAMLVIHDIMDYRVGYWCVRFDGRQFVADTFLFLTMEGTPEGDELWQKLRMRRADREWTGLDELLTFMASDVRGDAELVDILKECGCGHLFDLAEKLHVPPLIKGSAASIREYVGPKRLQRALAGFRNKPRPRANSTADLVDGTAIAREVSGH